MPKLSLAASSTTCTISSGSTPASAICRQSSMKAFTTRTRSTRHPWSGRLGAVQAPVTTGPVKWVQSNSWHLKAETIQPYCLQACSCWAVLLLKFGRLELRPLCVCQLEACSSHASIVRLLPTLSICYAGGLTVEGSSIFRALPTNRLSEMSFASGIISLADQ